MDEVVDQITKLEEDIDSATKKIDLDNVRKKFESLKQTSLGKDFWQDQKKAQHVMREIGQYESRLNTWDSLVNQTKEAKELASSGDKSLKTELEEQIRSINERFIGLKKELKFSGQYDSNNVILSIYAGAGGTDAQDWAEMLKRMYLRYLENNNYSVDVISQSVGDEAGIKSITFEVRGSFAYGKLKSEDGVHRLVRLSPFNSDNLRQTSFARVEVVPEIENNESIEINPKDLKIDVYRAGGHGGQSVNTTDSAVRVTHKPTNIVVSIQNERSQLQNKETALTIIRSKLLALKEKQHKDTIDSLKSDNTSAEWGNQIRSYILHPYKMVKDLRTKYDTSDVDKVLDGDIDEFIDSYLEQQIK